MPASPHSSAHTSLMSRPTSTVSPRREITISRAVAPVRAPGRGGPGADEVRIGAIDELALCAPHRVVGTGAGVLKIGGHVGGQFDVERVVDAALDRARDGVGTHGQLRIDVRQSRTPGHQAHGRADHHDDGHEDARIPEQQPDAQRIRHR